MLGCISLPAMAAGRPLSIRRWWKFQAAAILAQLKVHGCPEVCMDAESFARVGSKMRCVSLSLGGWSLLVVTSSPSRGLGCSRPTRVVSDGATFQSRRPVLRSWSLQTRFLVTPLASHSWEHFQWVSMITKSVSAFVSQRACLKCLIFQNVNLWTTFTKLYVL